MDWLDASPLFTYRKLIKPISARLNENANALQKLTQIRDESDHDDDSSHSDDQNNDKVPTITRKPNKRRRTSTANKMAKTALSPIMDLQSESSSPASFRLGRPALTHNHSSDGPTPIDNRDMKDLPQLKLQDSVYSEDNDSSSYRRISVFPSLSQPPPSKKQSIQPLRPSLLSTFISASPGSPSEDGTGPFTGHFDQSDAEKTAVESEAESFGAGRSSVYTPSELSNIGGDKSALIREGDIADVTGDSSERTPRWRLMGALPRTPRTPKQTSPPPIQLETLIQFFQPDETAFYQALEEELMKVETFYRERLDAVQVRTKLLIQQGKELRQHRRTFRASSTSDPNEALSPPSFFSQPSLSNIRPQTRATRTNSTGSQTANYPPSNPFPPDLEKAATEARRTHDPEAYKKYKSRLQEAVLEHFKSLEILKNYRALNMTGFRKALKKFDKAAKNDLTRPYSREKLEKQAFFYGAELERLTVKMEEVYADCFEHGDKKRARSKLRSRVSTLDQPHHYSTFRSGACIGLALPAIIHGLVLSFQPATRAQIPAWSALLQVYSMMFIPVIFSVLIHINLIAWTAARIIYRFIFEMDTCQSHDYRQYLELPSFLLFTLSYAFWFSFAQVGSANVSPTTWPLAWFCFSVFFLINPFPFCQRSARVWLLRTLWRLLSPFYSRVEFSAFFVADELNSLSYSLSYIWFMGCAYNKHWPGEDTWNQCNANKSWLVGLLLCVPALIRMLQCIQRWRDSSAKLQLINAGKYGSTIAVDIFFIIWRSRGESESDRFFIVWCIFAIINSTYTSCWDIWIDMGLCRPKDKFLRSALVYSEQWKLLYYFAMISNVFIRWIWVIYIPQKGLSIRIKAFTIAVLEMLRRWQWNFFRLENEHVGNADQYRVSRELPLPYDVHEMSDQINSSDDENRPRNYGSTAGATAREIKSPMLRFKKSNTSHA